MAETENITVATTSTGLGSTGEPGRSVDLPVVELLTGRGFVTGKSGSGKSNTASVVAEKLLDNGFGLLIVDIDGEYYGLKEEYEILHVGGDEECDIQVTEEHAGKIASLALEQNVPIILDVSSYLDEDEAESLLCAVAKQLFAKAKKQKQPFLMLIEECHEWIPENGSIDEVGKLLIKIGKRGRKHGLGIVGISQRPADVKKDYITQCDWLVWHRLTWNNDTKVVGRILDSDYEEAVEDLGDGEAFLMTDWAESIQRVQFHRKQTFDAGATPGLDDFERPELKSVSDDLVSELTEISEEEQKREDRIEELRETLDEKNSRIAELEKELRDARDLERFAEQFTEAMLQHVEGYNPGRTVEDERRRSRRRRGGGDGGGRSARTGVDADGSDRSEPVRDDRSGAPRGDGTDRTPPAEAQADGGVRAEAGSRAPAPSPPGDGSREASDESAPSPASGAAGTSSDDATAETESTTASDDGPADGGSGQASDDEVDDAMAAVAGLDGVDLVGTGASEDESDPSDDQSHAAANGAGSDAGDGDADAGPDDGADHPGAAVAASDDGNGLAFEPFDAPGDRSDAAGGAVTSDEEADGDAATADPIEAERVGTVDVVGGQSVEVGASTDAGAAAATPDVTEAPFVRECCAELVDLPQKTRKMLEYYVDQGADTPLNAHFSAGGSGDRTDAYAHNRRLRTAGFVEHVGRGRYDARLQDLVRERAPRDLTADEVVDAVTRLRTELDEE